MNRYFIHRISLIQLFSRLGATTYVSERVEQLVKVSLVQTDIIFGRPELNMENIELLVGDVITDLIVLPELFLTGYDKPSIETTAFSDANPTVLDWVKKLSSEKKAAVYGSIAEEYNGEYFNTAVLVKGNELLAKYRKRHLFGPMGEKELFSAGDEIISTNLLGTELGLSICYDLRFPDQYQTLSNMGAEVLLLCAEWPSTRISHWIALAKARAIENQSFVVAVNRVGDDPNYTYGGNSVVFDPFGEQLVHLDGLEAVETVNLDLRKIKEFKAVFDIIVDRI